MVIPDDPAVILRTVSMSADPDAWRVWAWKLCRVRTGLYFYYERIFSGYDAS